MAILITRCYSEVTPESAEDGETSDNGFICEDAAYTFLELVRLLKDHPESSQWPSNGSTFEWRSTGYCTYDYTTGTEREETVHYSRNNNPRSEKYWKLALRLTA